MFEAKTKFSELVEKVQRGHVFKITKRGRPVARLVAAETDAGLAPAEKPGGWELFKRIQKGGSKLSSKELDKLVRESRHEFLGRTEKLLR